jgi:hypothetical protein
MATKDILRFKDGAGVLKTPITAIAAGAGISISRPKDITNTYDLDTITITATGGGGSSQVVEGTLREVKITDRIEADLSVTKVFGLEPSLKLKDETLTFNGAITGAPSVSLDAFTMFFHTVTV